MRRGLRRQVAYAICSEQESRKGCPGAEGIKTEHHPAWRADLPNRRKGCPGVEGIKTSESTSTYETSLCREGCPGVEDRPTASDKLTGGAAAPVN